MQLQSIDSIEDFSLVTTNGRLVIGLKLTTNPFPLNLKVNEGYRKREKKTTFQN